MPAVALKKVTQVVSRGRPGHNHTLAMVVVANLAKDNVCEVKQVMTVAVAVQERGGLSREAQMALVEQGPLVARGVAKFVVGAASEWKERWSGKEG